MRVVHDRNVDGKWANGFVEEDADVLVDNFTTRVGLKFSEDEDEFRTTVSVLVQAFRAVVTPAALVDAKSVVQDQRLFENKCRQAARCVKRPEVPASQSLGVVEVLCRQRAG